MDDKPFFAYSMCINTIGFDQASSVRNQRENGVCSQAKHSPRLPLVLTLSKGRR